MNYFQKPSKCMTGTFEVQQIKFKHELLLNNMKTSTVIPQGIENALTDALQGLKFIYSAKIGEITVSL